MILSRESGNNIKTYKILLSYIDFNKFLHAYNDPNHIWQSSFAPSKDIDQP